MMDYQSHGLLQNIYQTVKDADRQTVQERINEGQSMEEAVADFISDEYFDNWYEETLTKLQAYEDGQ